jgi:quercetin dioxygenase-like cupin family protein
MTNVTVRADEQLTKAREASSGRSAYMAVHDGRLRQTLIALTAGNELAEHNAPPAASVFVLRGRVRLIAGDDVAELTAGALVTMPRKRHSLAAAEDSVVLLTTVAD